jgi:hypothetical protein
MKKVPSVSAVRVSLKEGLTILDLKPGNTMTLADLRRIIRNNGFVSKEASVVARGTAAADNRSFAVSGTNEQLLVSSAPQKNAEDWRLIVRAPDKP